MAPSLQGNKTAASGQRSSNGRSKQQQSHGGGSGAPQLSSSKLLQYERKGYLVMKQLLQARDVQAIKRCAEAVIAQDMLTALRHRVRVLCPGAADASAITSPQQALELIQRTGSSQLGFLQFFNLHRQQPLVLRLARDPRLAGTAAQPGFTETNWHSDLRMAPLDTNSFVTAWIPLRPIKGGDEDSGLLFGVGSHRDFALPFWHDLEGRDLADRQYKLEDTGPMALGDVSWHHGWLLHAAPGQPAGSSPRLALALSFFADGARLLARRSDPSVHVDMLHDEDAESYSGWLGELKDGAPARHPLLPLVFPSE